MEQIQIIGNIGKDIAVAGSNGSQEAYFTVAVDKSYKKTDGTKVEQTNWYTIWKTPSKLDSYLKKGTKVFVQGSLNMGISEYNGKPQIKLSMNNPTIKLLSAKETTSTDIQPSNVATNPLPADDQDLPF